MVRHGSSLVLCLLALTLTLAYAQEASDPFIPPPQRHRHRHHHHHQQQQQHQQQHHKNKQHRLDLETKRGPSAAGRSTTSLPFSLDQFIRDSIIKAVKGVEKTDFTYLENRAARGKATGRQVVGEAAEDNVARNKSLPRSGQQAQLVHGETRPDSQSGARGSTRSNQGAARSTHDDRGEEGVGPLQRVAAQSNGERRLDDEDELPEGLVTSARGLGTSGAIKKEEENGPPREERPQAREKPEPHDSLYETEGEAAGKNERRRLKNDFTEQPEAAPSSTGRSTIDPSTETDSTKALLPQSSPSHEKGETSRQTEEPAQANRGKQFRGQDKEDRGKAGTKDGKQKEGKGSIQTSGRPDFGEKTRPALSKQRAEDHWNWEQVRPPKKGCPGCSKRGLSITRTREHHKQVLRNQLLDKLRLVPTFTKLPWRPKLPDEVFPDPPQRDHEDYDDQYYAKPDRLLVFGRDLGPRHRLRKSGTGCYQFAVTGKVKGRVTSADLWVYKMRDAHDIHGQTLVITDLRYSKRRRLRERSLVARTDTHVKEGWVRFDVTRLVHRWLKEKTPPAEEMLAVRCKTCHRTEYRAIFGAKSNFRPVLVMEERADITRGSRRERREACDPSVRCCKFDMTVHFRDLGIYEIFHPRTLKVDYCHGTCERPDASHYNHTAVIQRQRFASHEPVNKTMFDRLRPCCVPVVLREASIMHYINDGLDTQVSRVPNLLVERCGCA